MIRYVLSVVVAASFFLAAEQAHPSPANTRQHESPPGDTSCVAAFDSMLAVFRRDYAGYQTRVVGHETAFTALVDSVREVARTPAADADYNVCIPALKRVTGFFRDAHLLAWQGSRPVVAPQMPGAIAGSAAAAAPAAALAVPPDDPGRPTLRRYDARTLVLRLPDFGMQYKPAVDSLVTAHRPALTATPTLVLDLRGNEGGCTCTYDALMLLVATGPVRSDGLDVWASLANVAWFRAIAADSTTPDTLLAGIRRVLPRLEAAPNTFVPWDAEPDVYTPSAALPRPAAVAVLLDSLCASSCEDFVRAVQQSRKATTFSATNTGGAGDYGNIRSVMLPGWRHLRVATSRSQRLRAGPAASTDFVGIAPDVRLPRYCSAGDAAVAFALRHRRARRPAARSPASGTRGVQPGAPDRRSPTPMR